MNYTEIEDHLTNCLTLIEEREEKEDNNDLDAPRQMMMLQGSRNILNQALQVVQKREDDTYVSYLVKLAIQKEELSQKLLERRTERKLKRTPAKLRDARTLGEFNQACLTLTDLMNFTQITE